MRGSTIFPILIKVYWFLKLKGVVNSPSYLSIIVKELTRTGADNVGEIPYMRRLFLHPQFTIYFVH